VSHFHVSLTYFGGLERFLAFNLYFALAPVENSSGLAFAGISQILSATTTVCATGLIALKIYTVTRKSGGNYTYSKVIEILVQSAALQSLVMIVDSIAEIGTYILVASNSNNIALALAFLQIAAYSSSCRLAVMVRVYFILLFPRKKLIHPIKQGIAPTLIAFRVAEERPRTEVDSTSRESPLSGLAFKHSARHSDTESDAKRTWMSTIRFGSVQRDDPVISVNLGNDLVDEAMSSERGQSIEKGMHIKGAEFV
jgi:hypothetical protein